VILRGWDNEARSKPGFYNKMPNYLCCSIAVRWVNIDAQHTIGHKVSAKGVSILITQMGNRAFEDQLPD
jgi:hypothetical protein